MFQFSLVTGLRSVANSFVSLRKARWHGLGWKRVLSVPFLFGLASVVPGKKADAFFIERWSNKAGDFCPARTVFLSTPAFSAASGVASFVMNLFSDRSMNLLRLFLVFPCCLMLGACASAEEAVVPPAQAAALIALSATPPVIPDAWQPLMERLTGDGLDGELLAPLFASLGDSPSQDPMGRKVQELYTNAFLRKPRIAPPPKDTTPNTTGIPRPWYKGMVTDANARLCRDFIGAHTSAFSAAEKKFGVPPDVAVALLFVETRLGAYLGSGKALPTLASMSATRGPDAIPNWLAKLPGSDDRLDWIRGRMEVKSDWAYNELKALLLYSQANGLAPSDLPCSVYGAIGLCQFMPSNIDKFAQDGDSDGVIDLFNPPDAVFSLGSYLHQHGWKRNMTVPEQIKVLRKYNNLGIYANTILALASKIRSLPPEVSAL